MSIGSTIKELREKNQLTQSDLAKIVGVTDKAVSAWENELKTPRMGNIQKIADYFGVQKSYIIEDEPFDIFSIPGIEPPPETEKKPLLGIIACGEPLLAEENIESYLDIPKHIKCDFCLRCKGNSMINARINDGDIVCIKQQPMVDNGEIAAVLIDDEATLKRFYRYGDTVVLRAENPTFKDLEYRNSQLDEIRIIGKATDFISRVK